ncbi:MAG: glycoside hydrolase family 3 protein [Spirochaetaceae bacterium]
MLCTKIVTRTLSRATALLLLFTTPLVAQSTRAPSSPERTGFWADEPEETVIDTLMRTMSDEEILGQIFLVGWPTTEPTPELMRWIRERNIGGIKIFGWNGTSLPALASSVSEMQAAALATSSGIPLFTATDQEGGWVRHVKDGTSLTPGNLAIGASGLPYDAYRTASIIGRELRALGINMNFAPTVDVYSNPEAHVIGPRAFSSDPVETALLGVAYYRGLEEQRVIATAKHFPGHGNATGDSHGMLPIISDRWEDLWERDLIPYRFLIREGVPAVLSGHLSFPAVSGEATPASISSFFKTEVLRERLGFEGIVITDDLYMGGALVYGRQRGWSFAEICLRAIEAGNDMIMLSRTPGFNDEIWKTLYEAYQSDPLIRERVRESVRRILRIKLRYLKDEEAVPLDPSPREIRSKVPDPQAAEFFLDHASRSVTVVRGEGLPFEPAPGERILLVGNDRDFLGEGRSRFPEADTFSFETSNFYYSSPADRAAFRRVADQYDTIIYCLADPNSLQVLQAAAPLSSRVIVFSILTPVYLAELPWVENAVAVYGWGRESFEAGYAAILGDYAPGGRMPVGFLDGPKRNLFEEE